MSRLIVKNLPPNMTDDKLLKTFSSHGLVIILLTPSFKLLLYFTQNVIIVNFN